MPKKTRKKSDNRDSVQIRQKKGTWLRFIKTFFKCRLPWVWLAVYVVLYFGFLTVGVDVTDRTAQLFAGDVSAELVASLIGLMILNILGSAVTVFIGHIVSARTNRNMRRTVLKKVLNLPLSFFKEENPRETIYRIVNNSIVVDSTIMVFLLPLFGGVYTMVQYFIRVFKYDWRLSVIMIAFVPLVIFMAFLFGRINFSLSDRDSGLLASLTQRLSEMMTNIPLAKAFAKESTEEEKGKALTSRLYKINIKSSWFDELNNLSETFVSLLQAAAITITGVILINDGSIDRRAWVAFFMFSGLFMAAVSDLTMLWNNIKIIQGNAARLTEIMDAKEEPKGGEHCERLSGGIHMDNVRFGYNEDKTVLDGISCDFPENTVTALLGVSGCGKTTAANLLTRLYQPQEGTITVGGEDISKYALDDYRKNFAVVSQNTLLFSGTVRENVLYGNEDVTEEQLTDALKNAGAYDFVMNMPGKLDAKLEEYGNNLSGGQKQRLSMARALLSNTPFFILDEPVAAMDAVAVDEIMDILAKQSQDRCVIVIAHTPAVLKLAEHVVVLEDGHIESEGSAEEVKQSSSFVKDFMRGAVPE
ncbi:MAG: ABC transporter ATP-binding protein [Eubacterium sp.]|nr:ABC transporter ATP-binding protein [Eubacterium sp.]